MVKCSTINCSFNAIEKSDKCILHCIKGEYSEDFIKGNFLSEFNNWLIEYILDKIFETKDESDILNKVNLRGFLIGTDKERYKESYKVNQITSLLEKQEIKFTDIHFPAIKSRDVFDYTKALKKIGGVHFDRCHFYSSSIDLDETKVFFQECTFIKNWYLNNHKILEKVIYQSCIFKNDICTVAEDYQKPEFDDPVFSDCIFEKNLILQKIEFKSALFRNSEENLLLAKNIKITQCIFNERTIFNKYQIENFSCIGSAFKEKFEFKNNLVQSFYLEDSNFFKLVDCYKTEFKKCKIYKSIFDDFVGFEECAFGKVENSEKNATEFIYATFLSFINFRRAKFLSGLDLKRINIKSVPNFYGVFIEPTNTDRETFRLVKDSFDKVGNFIDANDFYVFEMMKLEEELKYNKDYAKRTLLFLYKTTSNYGQSYILPIIWLLISSITYWLIVLGYEKNYLYAIHPDINFIFDFISYFCNGIARAMLPFNNILKQGMESVSLLFYIIFTSLIWLLILAIKRNTKR